MNWRNRFVDDVGQSWRWLSMRLMALNVALLGAWVALPDDLKQYLPHRLIPGLAIFVLLGGMLGRIVKQTPPPPEGKQ